MIMKKVSAIITCFGGGAPAYKPQEIKTPTAQDEGVTASRDSEARRRRAAASNTVLTSATGAVGAAPTQMKTLLGG